MFILKTIRLRHLISAAMFLAAGFAHAAKVNGLLTAGSYAAIEKFAESSDGTKRNDVATVSSRAYLKVSEWGNPQFEFTSDLRDKHDFFDKVEKERLELRDSNTFQVRQLSFRYPGETVFATVGRFPVPEAGAVYNDGLEFGVEPANFLRIAAFGGANPKLPTQSALTYNKNSYVGGSYFVLQPTSQTWKQNFYMSNAFVTELVESQTDRSYWYNNTTFQWAPNSRIVSFSYLDFVPRTYLQIASFTYQQGWSNTLSSSLGVLGVDSIGYVRRQNVREKLEPSVYKEFNGKVSFKFTPNFATNIGTTYGKREADQLTKTDSFFSLIFSSIFSRRSDANFSLGYRDNFTSLDSYIKYGIGYFSNLWEITFDQEYAIEKQKSENKTYHPLSSELSLAHYLEKTLFLTLSLQDVRDERVQIYSGFVKLTYRYGNRELPPIRDGAPPRGRL